MNKAVLAAATALSMVAIPAAAQVNHVEDKRDMTEAEQTIYDSLDTDQRAAFDTYTPDQRVMYFGWNDALRGYYWSLDQEEQNAWWYLDDAQRATLFQIQSPEQREAAWDSVIAQVEDLEMQTAEADTAAYDDGESAAIQYVSNAIVQSAPAPMTGEYPVCASDADDSCINAWAAGERGPGVDRPLNYWPGEPASS